MIAGRRIRGRFALIACLAAAVFAACEVLEPLGPCPDWFKDDVAPPQTVWLTPDIITSEDRSLLDSVTYLGIGAGGFWDPYLRQWNDTLDLFVYRAHFEGGATMIVQAHPYYQTPDSAMEAALFYLQPISRLPFFLIAGAEEMEISPGPEIGAGGNGCGNIFHWTGDIGQVRQHWTYDFMEEVALHESSHVVLEDCGWSGADEDDRTGLAASSSDEWKAAQENDRVFISRYAKAHPDREDMAETWWGYFVLVARPDRVSPAVLRNITCGVPHRHLYFQHLYFDLYPFERKG